MRFLGDVERRDIGIGAMVLVVVALLVLPMPTVVLDVLLVVSVASSLVMLVVSLSLRGEARLSAFPTFLLITTLFRLSLNVASTRLILLDADAGKLIEATGRLLVGGNYIVGIVIFCVIAIVQFVVVARGAERVSEVAARFALDAMPGEQLAVESELRSGAIDVEEARARRAKLASDAQLFGAMDGAMKFVKGDAIAGIAITVVNITAGMAIGVGQLDMALGEAAGVYSVLTIGDGLLSQLPSLFMAFAAGIVVTSVPRADRSAVEVALDEVTARPAALYVCAAVIVAVALVPGAPALPLLVVALSTVALAHWKRGRRRETPTSASAMRVPHLARVELHVSEAMREALAAEQARFDGLIHERRSSLANRRGVVVPLPAIRTRDSGREVARLCIEGVPVSRVEVAVGDLEALASWFEGVVTRHLETFVDIEMARSLREAVTAASPATVEAVANRTDTELTEILRSLVAEGVSIRNSRRILELVARHEGEDIATTVEHVRVGLAGATVHELAEPHPTLRYYEVGRDLSDLLFGALNVVDGRVHLALGAELREELAQVVVEQTASMRESGRTTVVVAERRVRRQLWQMLRGALPEVVVLAPEELVGTVAKERVGWLNG